MSVEELDLIFFKESDYIYEVAGKNKSSFPTMSDFIKEMKIHPDKVFSYTRHNNKSKVYVTPIFGEMQKNPEYIERKTNIENKLLQNKKILINKLHHLQNRKKELESATFSEIIQSSKDATTVQRKRY